MTTALILAGGESSRLRPLGDKSLQRFNGVSLIHQHVTSLYRAGIRNFVIVTNAANRAAIENECALLSDISCAYVNQPAPIGMGDAVAIALREVPFEQPVYITQVHDIFAPDFHAKLLAEAQRHPDTLLIAARETATYFPGGYLIPADTAIPSSNALFAVQGIVEKPGAGHEPSTWITLVAHVIPRAGALKAAMETTAHGDRGDHYERALAILMQQQPSFAVPHAGITASLKYPWQMLDVMDIFLNRIEGQQISPSAIIADGVSIRGNVIIEAGVRIFPGAAVLGPAYIGAHTIVGNGALVRGSMVGEHSIAGYATEVARSWIGDNVWFHTNYVGDSVIDNNVSFGSGTVTGNLRLDEGIIKVSVKGERISTGRNKLGQIIGSGTRVGINASLMPGVVIGRNAFVGPGVILSQDVPDGKRVTVRPDLVWSENTYQPRPEDREAFRHKLS